VNKRREVVFALSAGALTISFESFSQQQARLYRIGFLDPTSAVARAEGLASFRRGLLELGYVENKNYILEFRGAEGNYDRIPELVADLIRAKVDVLVTNGTSCSIAAKQATNTIPIVMLSVGDPIATKLVTSLSRPAGNATGLALLAPELMFKRFELLNETTPRTRRVAMLVNPQNPSNINTSNAAEAAAKSLKMGFQRFEVRNLDEIKDAFVAMSKAGIGAVVFTLDTILASNHGAIALLAEKQRIPSFGPAEYAQSGGLIGLGPNSMELYRRTATFIDKVLRGANPGDIPIEQPTKFELIVNLKTAKAIGVKIPQSILIRADKVIE
jgi:putative ABC transport system substrate-binding protein